MKEMKKLEDVLKEKFSGREVEQNPDLLVKIFSKMDAAPEKKRSYPRWLIAASMAGIIVIAGVFILYIKSFAPGDEIAKSTNGSKENSVKEIPLTEQKREASEESGKVNKDPREKQVLPPKELADRKQPSTVLLSSQETKAAHELPDSSKVFLNKFSQLMLAGFNKEGRTVTLNGEAFFEVKNASGVPFTVQCGAAYIEVVGTAFNVRVLGGDTVEVAVAEGKVKFGSSKNSDSFVFLSAGEKALYYNGKFDKKIIKDLNYFIWKTDVLTFNKTSISDALETMQKYFNVRIHVSDKAILNCHVSGRFKNPDIEKVFGFFNKTLEIEHLKKDHEYFLTGKGCN